MTLNRPGIVLLEVIVALTILTVAGAVVAVMAAESARAVRLAREAEAEYREASAFLDAVVLWTREDLDRRLGDREQGNWRLRIARPEPTLYTIVLTDSLGQRKILSTAVFRPMPSHGEP